ncbi:MAG: hypothetical protein EZS28_012329, partial [Streblomastix strix]
MTSAYNKAQIIELGNLFGIDLSRDSNITGRNQLAAQLKEFQVDKPHAYSKALVQRIKTAIDRRNNQIKQQQRKRDYRIREQQRLIAQQQRQEQLKRERKQRFEQQLQLFYEGRINHENLKQFITHDEQDHQEEARELEEYMREQREKERQDENQKQIEDEPLNTLFNPSQEQEEITTKSEKLKEKDNLDQQNDNLEDYTAFADQSLQEYFDQLDRLDFDDSARQRADKLDENEQQFLQERTQRLLDEERANEIRKLDHTQFREIEVEDADALLLSEPFNQALYRRAVRSHRLRYPRQNIQKMYGKRQSDNFEPTRHYYHNHITNQEDIDNHVRNVGTQELQMNHFKIAFDFGFIVEIVTYNEDQVQEVHYDVRYPHNNILSPLNPESNITSNEQLENFIKFLPAKIIENQERTLEDTHTRFIAIVSMVVVAYRDRAGGAAPAELQKFIKRQEVKFVDNKNYRNNCLFDALSSISLLDETQVCTDGKLKLSNRRATNSRVAEGKRLMKQFYSAIGNEQIKKIEQFCNNYQGFDLASEGKQLANIFNINICVYAYHHLDFDEEPTQEVEIQPKLNSKGNRIHRKKEDRVKEEKYDNYFLDFVVKPDEKII